MGHGEYVLDYRSFPFVFLFFHILRPFILRARDRYDFLFHQPECSSSDLRCVLVGELYPSASVLGVDLSPIQPDWVPPNVRFMVDDVESPWLHPRSHFDYIHCRHTIMAIKDWETLLRRCYE